ncbi:hypothetical protein F5879DRAFT_993671 [Lentinula edodes]|nr:hypothetical protein F5879DRAFT_993671 [Lentinula edodes]
MPSSSNNAALGAPSLVRTLPPSQLLPLHVTPENPDIDKLTTTVEDPSLGQLWLFKSVFGMCVSLAHNCDNKKPLDV